MRQAALNASMPISSISSLVFSPSCDMVSSSAGSPWQSQPKRRSTRRPRMVWKRGTMSLT